jgi:small conductance mechanosensitive channel
MNTNWLQQDFGKLGDLVFYFAPKIVYALLVLLIGLWLTSFAAKALRKILLKRELDISLVNFLCTSFFYSLRVLLFITVISKLGIETSSFVAILGAAGLAIGLSLQGSLANFAGGILIIVFKPFRVGDMIDAQGEVGKVLEIQLFSTKICTGQNHIVYIPNGILSNGKIKNQSENEINRLDILLTFSRMVSSEKIKERFEEFAIKNEKVDENKENEIYIESFQDNTITYKARLWCLNDSNTRVKSDLHLFFEPQLNSI